MCCAQGVTHITMAELPTLPLTPDGGGISAGRYEKICSGRIEEMGGVFLPADLSKSAKFELFLTGLIGK